MREAFKYMFKDPDFKTKFVSYFTVCFFSLMLMATPEVINDSYTTSALQTPQVINVVHPIATILPVLGFILNLILSGYYFCGVQTLTIQKSNFILPHFLIWKSFVKGFRFLIASILFVILVLLHTLLTLISPILGLIFAIFCIVFFAINFNSFVWIFANENKLTTFFAWKKSFKTIKNNAKSYFKAMFILFLVITSGTIIATLINKLFNFVIANTYASWTIVSFINAIICSYTAFVSMHLIAKSIKTDSVV